MPHFGVALLGLLGTASLLVWWRIFVNLQNKQPVLPFRERAAYRRDLRSFLFVVLMWVLIPVVTGGLFGLDKEPSIRNVYVSCVSNLLVFGLGLVVMMTIPSQDGVFARRLSDFGITLDNWRNQCRDGVLGYIASFLPVSLVLLATSPLRSEQTQHSFLKILNENPGMTSVVWIGIAVVVLAPLAEEFIFRVVVQGWLQRVIKPGYAILFVSILFSGAHGFPDSLALVPLALILGYVYYRRNSFLAVVVLHALFNAVNLLNALLFQQTESTDPAVSMIPLVLQRFLN